ncbi:DinB family protein [Paenibacillus sp. strain BS8-2]
MPKLSKEMVEEFKSFIQYVEGLKSIKEENWNQPISDGKWTLKDIISHIMLWDKYFYEEAIQKVKLEESVTVRHLNFDEFNANAIEFAKTQTIDDIIEKCIEYRSKIIEDISELTEEEYLKEYKDGDKKKFSIRGYLRGFIPHDKHHKKQIEKFIKELKTL